MKGCEHQANHMDFHREPLEGLSQNNMVWQLEASHRHQGRMKQREGGEPR